MRLSTRTRRWLRVTGLIAIAVILICGLAAQDASTAGRIASERRDPSTGARWLLMRDAAHPAAPARWVLVEAGREEKLQADKKAAEEDLEIRAGDRIVVEEQTAVMSMQLEATALTSAESGGELRARLAIGGKVIAVRAIGPGRAEIEEEKRQ